MFGLALIVVCGLFCWWYEHRWIRRMIEADQRADEEHRRRMAKINGWSVPISAEHLSVATGDVEIQVWSKRQAKPRSRPNRRRKQQKLRAARRRKSWYHVLVHEDENG